MTRANDEPPVTVVFRVWRGLPRTVIALFPDTIATDIGHCVSFEHVGQHSAAVYANCIASSRPATPKEYAALKRELESAPYHYRLIVRRRKGKRP